MSIDFLQERIRKLKNPTMVGLDPYLPILPKHIVQEAFDRDGQTLAGAAAAYYRFCTAVSYTHLDVYKRQGLFSLMRCSGVITTIFAAGYCCRRD